ncbi:MAG: hypothetical protein JSU87_14780 [Gemmatimonadota bacterium]|nr:MAG: hypothetical protein JSU87_14780 [Gemmatimonadota bacterium]
MTYVPMPIHSSGQRPASPQAQELAHKIESVIREYEQSHPRMSRSEVEQAIRLAQSRTGAGTSLQRATLLMLLGLGVAMLLGALLFMRGL